MPYQYVIDGKIRENFDEYIKFKNSIVIFDEAHNVPQVCEDVMSFEISETKLETVIKEL
jgi:regulator of telomere elongation helicase 1